MSEEEMKALVEMKDMLKAENTKLKQKLEEQTKTYQTILQEQQNEIDQLQRNCDVFNEQMNDAVERATELQQEKEDFIKWLEERVVDKEEDMKIARDGNSDKIDKKSLLSYLDYGCGSYFELGSQHEEFLKNIKEYLGVDIDE